MVEKNFASKNENLENSQEKTNKKREEEKIKTNTKAKTVVARTESSESEPQFRLEAMDTRELTPEQIAEIADYYRYTFNNTFPKYAVCTDCETHASSKEVFNVGRKDYVPLEEMDKECNLPDCGDCGEQMKFFHNPEATFEKLSKVFSEKEGKITLVKSEDTDEVKGMVFGYYDTLEGAIETEWGHPYNYMKQEDQAEDLKFDVKGAAQKMIEGGVQTDDEGRVFCWNCTILAPEVRGKLMEMLKELFVAAKASDQKNISLITQTLSVSPVKRWLQGADCKEIEGIFDEKYSFLFGDFRELCYECFQRL